MKRTPLLFAGIVAATILVVMGLGIFLTGSFYFIPSITIDPFSDGEIDENGIMVFSGTTNLGVNTFLRVNISGASPAGEKATALASVLPGTGGQNKWKATVNVSPLPPGEYSLRVSNVVFSDGNMTAVPGGVFVKKQLTLGTRPTGADSGIPAPFIRANPLGEKAVGEAIEVSGTTNIEPGSTLIWEIEPVQYRENMTGTLPAGCTAVAPGTAGINRWSFEFDSSGNEPGSYILNITGDVPAGFSGNKTGDAVEFVLSGSAPVATPAPSMFITIDAVPDSPENARVTITGTTSLPAGEELVIEITPLVGSGYEFFISPDGRSRSGMFAGVTGTAVVVQGGGSINLWSMNFDTYHLPPGGYGVKVNNSKLNPATSRIEPGDVSCTTRFTVRGDA